MKHLMNRSALLAAIAVTLVGCATPVAPPPAPDEAALAIDKLIASSPVPPHGRSAEAQVMPARMDGQTMTVKGYVGEGSALLKKVADARGLKFRLTGPEPRLPLLVVVDVEGVTFDEFLRDVGHQFGQRADVVMAADGALEIRYRGL